MCAAVAAPVSPVKLNRNLIFRPVTVALKVPDPFAPFGAGISWLTVKNAFSFAVVTLRLVGPDEAASDDADTITATSAAAAYVTARTPIMPSFPALAAPCHRLIRDRRRFGLPRLGRSRVNGAGASGGGRDRPLQGRQVRARGRGNSTPGWRSLARHLAPAIKAANSELAEDRGRRDPRAVRLPRSASHLRFPPLCG